MVTTSTTSTIISDTTNTFINPLSSTEHKDILSNTSFANQQQHPQPSKQDIINNLIELAKQEQAKGNTSITSDKLDKLQSILQNKTKE